MKDKKLNHSFVNLVKSKIKDDKKLVAVICEILNIHKESAYRRLRNEVVFTFSEIIDISSALSLSIDHIVGSKKLCYPYELYGTDPDGLIKSRSGKVKRYVDMVADIVQDEECEYVEVTASMPVAFIMNSDYLLKWHLFIWDYHRYYNAETSYKKFDEYTYEEKITEYSKITSANLKKFNTTYFIINRKFIEDLSEDIKTLIELKSIRREDVDKIKGELIRFFDYLEKIVITGCYPESGKKVSVYISDFRIQSGFAYIKSKNVNASILKLFSFNGAISLARESFEESLKWFKSYERLSTLISISCELERRKFFDKQRQIIDAL